MSDQSCVTVELGPRSYDIVIVSHQLSAVATWFDQWLRKRFDEAVPRKTLIVTDRNVADPYAATVTDSLREAGWNCETAVLDVGEPSKSLSVAERLYDRLVDMRADRRTVVTAVGGGVMGDVAGFVAATYARGIPFVQIPTSLLAHVDSSVGGKVAVNHPRGKNLIGAFYQPVGVFIDTATIETLPQRDYHSGLAEVIKYGMILDRAFFDDLESHVGDLKQRTPDVLRRVIARCCRLKADIVEQDERETTGQRAVLNYGHTFAHAFENLCGYGELMHGEAVAIGMVLAGRLAVRLNRIDEEAIRRQNGLIAAVGLPTTPPDSMALSLDDIIDRMKLDKKTVADALRFILPDRIGRVELVSDVAEADVRAVLESAHV